MAKIQVASTNTERGPMISVTVPDTGLTQHLFIPDNLPPGVDQAATRLLAAYTLFNSEAARAVDTYVPELIGPHMMKAATSLLPSPYAGFIDAVGVSARDNKKVVADLGAVPASTVATAAVRQRAVQMFDEAPTIAAKIRLAAEVFGLPQLQGLVEVDALSILPDDVQAAIMDKHLMLSFASKYGIASKYPAIATPDNPIPSGINQDAVNSEAKAMVDAIRALTKKIENCSQIARDCIAYVSIACQCPVSTAFDLFDQKGGLIAMAKARGPVKLPSTICLRPIDAMNAAQVRDALNATRANICWWRKHDRFPRGGRTGNNVMISTADLAGWCASRGLKIEWL